MTADSTNEWNLMVNCTQEKTNIKVKIMINVKHGELRKFINNTNIKFNKFYSKEFESASGIVYYIHYFNDEIGTTIHESFIYNNSTDRENDLNKIKEKTCV